MKFTDKLRFAAIAMWMTCGALALPSLSGFLTVAAGLFFGIALVADIVEQQQAGLLRTWNREGFYYVARFTYQNETARGTVERKIDIFTYHLISLIHGPDVLRQMGTKMPKELQ